MIKHKELTLQMPYEGGIVEYTAYTTCEYTRIPPRINCAVELCDPGDEDYDNFKVDEILDYTVYDSEGLPVDKEVPESELCVHALEYVRSNYDDINWE